MRAILKKKNKNKVNQNLQIQQSRSKQKYLSKIFNGSINIFSVWFVLV